MKRKKAMKRINDFLADKLSLLLSAMITFYVILLLVTIPLFLAHPIGLVGWVTYFCTVIFQGIALPVLGYTSR